MAAQTPDLATPPATTPASLAPSHVSDPVAQTLALLQPWIDFVPQQQRRLGTFIFLALLAHIAVFFFIRIDTTRAELRHQAHPHITVENIRTSGLTGEQPTDDFWDRLTDPRLFLLPAEPLAEPSSDDAPLDFGAMNSNIGSHDWPDPAAPEDYHLSRPALAPLEQRAGEAMRPPRQPFTYEETAPAIAAQTTWVLGASLLARQPAGIPDLPSPISDTDLGPTELLAAVGADGVVEHVLMEQSCGDGRLDLDQQAVLAARKIRFHPVDQPGLVWGRLTVFWHYSAKPRVEVVPTPPSVP